MTWFFTETFLFINALFLVPIYAILIVSGLLICSIYTVNNEKKFLAFITNAALLAAICMWSNFNPFTYIVSDQWPKAIIAIGLYLVLGAIWGLFKWRVIFLNSISVATFGMIEAYDSYTLNPENRNLDKFNDYVKRNLREKGILNSRQEYPIKITQHISNISLWMMYWPISVVWSLIGDFFQMLYKRFVIFISGYMQSQADSQAAILKAEFERKIYVSKNNSTSTG